MAGSRIHHPGLARRIVSADDAAGFIRPGDTVGMSGFTGAGHPKAVPEVLAERMAEANDGETTFRINLWTGASTAPDLDGRLVAADGVQLLLPYQADPVVRAKINAGEMDYLDVHLSHVAPLASEGFLGRMDVALVEISDITENGDLVPSSSVGNNQTWLDLADRVILEVNSWQSPALRGMHDIYYGSALPPRRVPVPLIHPGDRIGVPYLRCPEGKVVAVVETYAPDSFATFTPPDETSRRIAGHVVDFLEHEVCVGRLPADLLPLQSGVGNVANAVFTGLASSRFGNLTAYSEIIQDSMLELLLSGKLTMASATALTLSADGAALFEGQADFFRERIVLRPQEISNHPQLIRELGVLSMNGMVEADIYGNVNSTHVMGTGIMNGIGGSGDFARNAYISMFMTPSTAKGGAISAIVPMVSHVDHTEHDVQVIVTEQGLADLRGLPPRKRAERIIAHCAHPAYRPMLEDYFARALRDSRSQHTPHLLREALGWHADYVDTGSMLRDVGATSVPRVSGPL